MSRFIDNWSFNSTQLCVCECECVRRRTHSPFDEDPRFHNSNFFQTFCVLFSNIQDEAQQKRWESFTDARVLCRVNAECRVSVWMVFWCLITLPICTSVIVAWFSVWTHETQMCFWFSPFKMQLIHAFDFYTFGLLSEGPLQSFQLYWLRRVCYIVSLWSDDVIARLFVWWIVFFARLRPRLFIRVCKRTFVWSFLYFVWNVSVF